MDIRIPKHSSTDAITKVPSRKIVERVLAKATCRVLKKTQKKGKPLKIEAQKILRNGRIHIFVIFPLTQREYMFHLHFDKKKLLTNHIALEDTRIKKS